MFFLLTLLTSFTSLAYFEHSPDAPQEMNGISFGEHKNFPDDWKLVTVRYREDSGELRLTYANPIAAAAMDKLKPDYPEGSKFGKVSYLTEDDPAFPSSKVPAGTKRYQLMVRNRKLYNSTNGWGYALFDEHGKLYKENVQEKTEACAACHQLVPERGYVFSRPLHYQNSNSLPASGIKFERRVYKDFKGAVKESLSPEGKWIESLTGPLQKHAFSGTLDEVVPLLIQRSKLTNQEALLYINEKNFTLVKPATAAMKKCEGSAAGVSVLIYFNGAKVREASHCK